MSIVRLILQQEYRGLSDDSLNVFHYNDFVDEIGLPGLEGLIDSFIADVLPHIHGVQSNDLEDRSIKAEVVGGTLFTIRTAGLGTGVIGIIGEPLFVCTSYLMVRASSLTRNGYKRFAGVPRGYASESGFVRQGTYGDAMDACAAALTLPLEASTGVFYSPVIYGRPQEDPPLPERVNAVVNCLARDYVTTQNTRKSGRGI